jgi:hypothetical protein
MMMLCMKNNNVYKDLIAREKAKRIKLSEDSQENGTGRQIQSGFERVLRTTGLHGIWKKIQSGFRNVLWTIRLHMKFTLAPIAKICPSVLFRVFSYSIILGYLSNFYNGKGLIVPLAVFAIPALLNFVVGKYILGIKDAEVVVNSVGGIVLPIYIDLFDVVNTYF